MKLAHSIQSQSFGSHCENCMRMFRKSHSILRCMYGILAQMYYVNCTSKRRSAVPLDVYPPSSHSKKERVGRDVSKRSLTNNIAILLENTKFPSIFFQDIVRAIFSVSEDHNRSAVRQLNHTALYY
ncbi:unnamed protein product [Timema podura]|uniref:Maturase K n=1 Tax=Timema podura TaxID=61482 RepID=A0ABN7P4P5_TIMPD|nr:unnamed protein product [Timema podura]